MKTISIAGLNEFLDSFYQAECEEAGVQPATAPTATRRDSNDPQGFNWDASFKDPATKVQATRAIGGVRKAGWHLD